MPEMGPVEVWIDKLPEFSGLTPVRWNQLWLFAREQDAIQQQLIEALEKYRKEHDADSSDTDTCACDSCIRADAALLRAKGRSVLNGYGRPSICR